MKIRHAALILTLLFVHLTSAQEDDTTPLAVVNKRMKALNAHELDVFLSTYAENVVVYVYPDRLLGKGKEHIKKLFAPMIEKGDVRVRIHHQLVADGYVVNETTTSFGETAETGISIYEVRNGLIQSVRFVRDSVRAPQVTISNKDTPERK